MVQNNRYFGPLRRGQIKVIVDPFPNTRGALIGVTYIGIFLPSLSVAVRRLHDTNHSGWWYWIALVPIIGGLVLFVFMCMRGTDGLNDYGLDPLALAEADNSQRTRT